LNNWWLKYRQHHSFTPLVIALFVLLRFTTSDYAFGIFKLFLLLGWSHRSKNYLVIITIWLTVTEHPFLKKKYVFSFLNSLFSFLYLRQDLYHRCIPLVVSTSRSFTHSWLITGFVTRLTRRVPLVEQELLTLLEHLSSPPVFGGVRVSRSLVLCVCFVDRCLSFCTLFFWLLCCLFFFNLRILIIPSNSSSLYICVQYGGCLIRRIVCLLFASIWFHPRFFVGSMLLIFLFFSFIFCFVCLGYVSCVSNVSSVDGLFISDCLSVFYVCLTLPLFNDSACTNK
jgi:hypothetical protein